ncbi:MAG: hypothetical protein R2725_04845 [Solirubrobacterales bacterium]
MAVGLLGAGLCGCGGGGGGAPAMAGDATTAAGQQGKARQGKSGTDPRCVNQLGGFLGSLDRVRDQLVAGVTYEQYVVELNDARAAYAKLPVEQLRLDCLRRVGTTGEQALNRYIAAAETWSECVEVPGCQSASIEAKLQRKWRQGSRLLSAAEDAAAGK